MILEDMKNQLLISAYIENVLFNFMCVYITLFNILIDYTLKYLNCT